MLNNMNRTIKVSVIIINKSLRRDAKEKSPYEQMSWHLLWQPKFNDPQGVIENIEHSKQIALGASILWNGNRRHTIPREDEEKT